MLDQHSNPTTTETSINANNTPSIDSTTSDPFVGLSFKVGVAENKNTNYRNKMEDVHTYIANFAERIDWGYFAIFDGHAGKETARWCGNNLHSLLEQEISSPEAENVDMRNSLCSVFVKADNVIIKEGSGNSGCTAAVAVLKWELDDPTVSEEQVTTKPSRFEFNPSIHHKRMLYTSNVGDSRIVLYRNKLPYRLSYDHKATDVNEVNRIRESGGLIMKNRVNGVLAVTRSLGDSYMKELVIGKPFTTCTEITANDEFMILACDGVWDVISDLDACEFVSDLFQKNPTLNPQQVAKKLCQLAIDNSTTDNVTVMVVKFDEDVFKDRN
jgi:protein phosphatase PTC1